MRGLAVRRVVPEVLDELPPEDPRAIGSRRDLRRVHRAMRSLSILLRLISAAQLVPAPRRIIELGAGDGSLMLRLARALGAKWTNVALTLLDRNSMVDRATLAGFGRLGWTVDLVNTDVLTWARGPAAEHYDLCVTTLFLHHFENADLKLLLAAVAARTRAFVACEPRRSALAWVSSHFMFLLGANAVTRGDAVKSVTAGFAGRELAAAWPQQEAQWTITEGLALPFTHCFSAVHGN